MGKRKGQKHYTNAKEARGRIEQGDRVKHADTGLAGIVIGTIEWPQSSDRTIVVQPETNEDRTGAKTFRADESKLKILKPEN